LPLQAQPILMLLELLVLVEQHPQLVVLAVLA
jgi:hypothetical protein